MNNAAALIGSLSAWAGVKCYPDAAGQWTCPQIADGRPLCAFDMISELRLMKGQAVGILSKGWLDFKDTAKRHAIHWSECVELKHPDQIRRCRAVLVGKDAHNRHDWRQWVGKLPRTLNETAGLFCRTAAPDLSITQLAQIMNCAPTTARRYVEAYSLPVHRTPGRARKVKSTKEELDL